MYWNIKLKRILRFADPREFYLVIGLVSEVSKNLVSEIELWLQHKFSTTSSWSIQYRPYSIDYTISSFYFLSNDYIRGIWNWSSSKSLLQSATPNGESRFCFSSNLTLLTPVFTKNLKNLKNIPLDIYLQVLSVPENHRNHLPVELARKNWRPLVSFDIRTRAMQTHVRVRVRVPNFVVQTKPES